MRRLLKREEGFTLAWLAMILFLLLAMAGFGTDLGWIYLNTVRTQNAVDAAALAGVVNLPAFDPGPDAKAAATANGYDPDGADTLTLTPMADNELHAELSTSIEPFFMRVLGFTHFDITRESTARYIKPVPLGSPTNCFGGGDSAPPCSGSEDFWAAVSGRHSLLEDGDPYSTLCDENDGGCDHNNPSYARAGAYEGYYYGVEVASDTHNLEVYIYNGAYDPGGPAGDSGFSGPSGDIEATFKLYRPDTTPLIPQDHLDGTLTPECTLNSASASSTWTQLCTTIADPDPGIWLVRVQSTTEHAGSNNFAIRAEASTTPQVYGINDMSIWSDDLVGASDLYLAEIAEEHAGKKLELAFYDAGDAFDASWYRVRDPHGNIPTCSWTVWSAAYPLESATQLGSGGPDDCQWQTQAASPGGHQGFFNKEWIVAVIDLPEDPDDMCAGTGPEACFWKMELDLSEPTERTTWRARVIGNPVQLIPTPTSTTTVP